MVGATEALLPSLSVQAPTKALANAIPVEVMTSVSIEEITPVRVEALPKPLRSPASVRIRALAPVWPTPARSPSPIPSVHPLELGLDGPSAPGPSLQANVSWPSVQHSLVPIPSVYPSGLGRDGLSLSGDSPPAELVWPSVEPSIDHSAFPSGPVRSKSDSSPPDVFDGSSVEPIRGPGAIPSSPLVSSCYSTGGRPVYSHNERNIPWDGPSYGPSCESLVGPSVEPLGIPSPSAEHRRVKPRISATSEVSIAPRALSSMIALSPRAEEWNQAQCMFHK
jgi:hypothetical protein